MNQGVLCSTFQEALDVEICWSRRLRAIHVTGLHSPGPRSAVFGCLATIAANQQLAGRASLGTTARYIEGDQEAQRKVVALI